MDQGAQTRTKMSGYLCKKSKMRMLSTWKTYWFVLEDRLLLYYRSKDEYKALSPCKGQINLGPPCSVKSCPSIPNAFQIETRTNTFTLKADNSEEQMKWMQTIMAALNQNQNFATESQKRLSHFRYSLDDLIPEREANDYKIKSEIIFERQNSMPHRNQLEKKNSSEIIQRLQKIGAHSYGGSLGTISKIAKKSTTSLNESPKLERRTSAEKPPQEEVLRPGRRCGDNIYERISGDSNSTQGSNRISFMVDNENYSIPVRRSSSSIGQESATKNPIRETKSLLVENDQYVTVPSVQSDEVIYAEPKISEVTDVNKNSVLLDNALYATVDVKATENVYEDLDKYNIYSVPILKSEETSGQCSPVVQNKNKQKLKKSKSFIKRVWKRRSKKKVKEDEPELEEDIYEEVSGAAVEKVELNSESTIQMLSELQNILENKKLKLKAAVSNNSNSGNDQLCDNKRVNDPPASPTSDHPTIPPKTQKQAASFDTNTIESCNQEPLRSLDEIIEDLNKERVKSNKNLVGKLIEKFNNDPEDVVLRTHGKPDFKIIRHSDDLNLLLDELAKVTSAPIMTPGVTSSLVNPTLTDEQWIKLLPVRQRRLSEPDYDVPRPHKSIKLPVKQENSDAIPVTRFFGPVLQTDNSETKDDSLTPSMTPDSLENEYTHNCHTSSSYTSHSYDYKGYDDVGPQSNDKIIYALPKSYISVATQIVNTCHNIYGNQISDDYIIYKNVKNMEALDEDFADSLEATSGSTEF